MVSEKGTEHYISREDGRVYYHRVGRGEPIVFLHAVGLSGWSWRKTIDAFARHFTCHNIDMPGFDHSDIPPRKYSIEDYTRAIVDVLDGIALERTHIVADHTGSMVAVDLAANHPHRVNRMVLDGLPYWNKERGRAYFEKSFAPQHTDTSSYDVPVAPMLTWEEAVAQSPTNLDRELWEKREEIKGKSRLWIRFSQEANTSYDMDWAGPRVKSPTLLVYGESDVPRFWGELAHAEIEGSILKVFPGASGSAHHHDPEEFVRLALDFLLGHA